jgi:type II secretory pathway component PulF
MIAVAEESNRLATVLVEIADTQEARLARKIDVAVRMLEPVMLLVVFGLVFVIALAVLLPILQISMGGKI